jgi:transposase
MLLNREAVRQAGRILRTTEPPPFRPIEFRHFDQTRGVLLLHRDGRFYAGLHLFGETSRYFRHVPLEGFINWKTRQPCSGKSPIVVLPLEMSREFHEREFLERGSPQSAKLIRRLDDGGAERFFLNITFRIDSPPVETRTCLGIDRGMAKIAACTLIGRDRAVIRSGLDFEGEAFFAEQRRYEREIAAAQRKGKVSRRQFRLRGRAGANALGEFANRLVAFAAEHQAQIVLERLNAAAMRAFLRRSQIARLKQLLDYKTQALGLPKPIEVPAAYSSQTCLECGCRDPANRPRRDPSGRPIQHLFRCVRCGYEANADQNASRFIALRGLHRLESKKSGSKDLSFESFLEWLAKK